jgi:hypothetical protein
MIIIANSSGERKSSNVVGHENREDLENFSNTVDDLITKKTLSKNLLHLQEIRLVGADQKSIRA